MVNYKMQSKKKLFGVPLDPSDEPEKVKVKRAYIFSQLAKKVETNPENNYQTPYDVILKNMWKNAKLIDNEFVLLGEVFVEDWLKPKPSTQSLPLVSEENYRSFIDSDGCYIYSKFVEQFVYEKVLPDIPIMLGVDHSMTGGVLRALTKKFGVENVAIMVLDSHFDASLASIKTKLIGSQSFNIIPETYNSGSFLRFLINDGVVNPKNLALVGVSDYPTHKTNFSTEKNFELNSFTNFYLSFEKRGVNFITKSKIRESGVDNCINMIFEKINTPYIYISLDVDVGALSCVYASRMLNTEGLTEKILTDIFRRIKEEILKKKMKLIGLDVMEVDIHFLGLKLENGSRDRTLEIALAFLKTMLFS